MKIHKIVWDANSLIRRNISPVKAIKDTLFFFGLKYKGRLSCADEMIVCIGNRKIQKYLTLKDGVWVL